MDLEEFRRTLAQATSLASQVVAQAYQAIAQGSGANAAILAATPFAADAELSRAFWQNTLKMLRVKRITGEPYAVHPTRMAFMAMGLLPSPMAKRVALYCIFHDYLEEGDGVTLEGLARFRHEAPGWDPALYEAAVYLTEPLITPSKHPALSGLGKTGKYLTLSFQIAAVVAGGGEAELVVAALLDKLDNAHDLSYITATKSKSLAARAERLAHKLGYFTFVGETLRSSLHPSLNTLLVAAARAAAETHHILWSDVEVWSEKMKALRREHANDLQMIVSTHLNELGCGHFYRGNFDSGR